MSAHEKDAAEVMLENSRRRNNELRQNNKELEARLLVMSNAIHRAICWYEEWLSHGGTETVTIGAEIVSNALRKVWADNAGRELLDRLKKFEAVAKHAEVISIAGLNGGLTTHDTVTRLAYLQLTKALLDLKGDTP